MSTYKPAEIVSTGGRVLARVASDVNEEQPYRTTRYTAFCKDARDGRGEYSEEIDVDAISANLARKCAEAELAAAYEPGMRVSRIVKRFGLYF